MTTQMFLTGVLFSSVVTSQAFGQVSSARGGPAENAADVSISTHILQPRELPAPDVGALKVPPGFRITRVAQDLGNIRVLTGGTSRGFMRLSAKKYGQP